MQFLNALFHSSRGDRFIHGSVNFRKESVTFIRGNLKRVTVPLSFFQASGDGTTPDFYRLRIKDYGWTVAFGEYEASTDNILREFCEEYREMEARMRDWIFHGGQSPFHNSRLRILRLRVQRRIGRVWWWVMHRLHPRHRYHVLRTGLGPGWKDRDLVMASVLINLLLDFVEKERPFEWFDTEDSPRKEMWAKLKELYDFFKVGRTELVWEMHSDHERYDELTKKLVEIVEIREIFWT